VTADPQRRQTPRILTRVMPLSLTFYDAMHSIPLHCSRMTSINSVALATLQQPDEAGTAKPKQDAREHM